MDSRLELERWVLADMTHGTPHPSQGALGSGDFVGGFHREVFDALIAMRGAGIAMPGMQALYAWMAEHGGTFSPGELVVIVGNYNGDANIRAKVSMLKRLSVRRNLRDAGRGMGDQTATMEALIQRGEVAVRGAKSIIERDDYEGHEELCARVEAQRLIGDDPRSVATGFSDLDQYGWMNRGSLNVIGARTSVGKTAMSCSIVANAIQDGRGIAYASAEETPEQIVERLVRMLEPRASTLQVLRGARLRVRPARRVEHVEQAIGEAEANWPVELVVVDHLHDMHASRSRDSQVQELGDLMRELRTLAQARNVPMLICAQLSRPAAQRESLMLTDLRGSGEIEQLADRVWLLSRTGVEARLFIAKNRHGLALKTVPLVFMESRVQFVSAARME